CWTADGAQAPAPPTCSTSWKLPLPHTALIWPLHSRSCRQKRRTCCCTARSRTALPKQASGACWPTSGNCWSASDCPVCHGKRLRPESLAVKVNVMSIADFTDLPVSRAIEAVGKLKLGEREEQI